MLAVNAVQAAIIARLAHKGQSYGSADYFEFHVENVVRRCKSNKHCTYGHVVVAYLHDVIEDTELDVHALIDLGLSGFELDAVAAITCRSDEVYHDYIGRIIRTDPIALFVKYHDLLENEHQCRSVSKYADPITKERSASRLKRYVKAIERIRKTEPWWLYEGCRMDES